MVIIIPQIRPTHFPCMLGNMVVQILIYYMPESLFSIDINGDAHVPRNPDIALVLCEN